MSDKDLEPHIPMPRGGLAPRCQRVKRDGQQCAKPARTGYRTCPTHGAGYRSREEAGTRKRPGRPVTHGVYSGTPTRSYAEAAEEVSQLKDILTNSDRDLLALKSVLVMWLAKLDALAPDVEALEAELEQYVAEVAELDDAPLTPAEAMRLAHRFASWVKPLGALSRAVGHVADTASKSITASKNRAETDAKLAEAQGIRIALKLIQLQRRIIHGLAPDENHRTSYELALAREIYGPLRLEVPSIDLDPADL